MTSCNGSGRCIECPETMTKLPYYNEEVDAALGAEEAKRRFGDKIQIMASGDYWVDFVDVHSGKCSSETL